VVRFTRRAVEVQNRSAR